MTNDVIRYVRLAKNRHVLRRNAWLKRSELERIQQKKLRAIIKHAYNNVPFYHKLFDSVGVKPDDIKTVDDLSKIPIITKFQIQRAGDEIIANGVNINKSVEYRTSGSTGIPLKIIRCGKELSVKGGTYIRTYKENGQRNRDIVFNLTSPHYIPQKAKSWYYNLAARSLGIPKTIYVSVFEDIAYQVSTLKETKPDVILGYPISIKLLAMAVQDNGIEINPKSIFTASELLDTGSRKIISSVFGVDPIDFYVTIETDVTSWECSEHMGYHMNIDTNVIEFIKENERVAAGEKGEIILTNLYAYTMPIIRYKIGDAGVPSEEQCPCGRGLPLMDMIEGRVDDFLVLPSGKIISPRNINLLEYANGITSYKIIQEKRDKITVQLLKAKDFSQNTITEVKEIIKRGLLGEEINIDVEIVDEIPRDPSGKIRAVISKAKQG